MNPWNLKFPIFSYLVFLEIFIKIFHIHIYTKKSSNYPLEPGGQTVFACLTIRAQCSNLGQDQFSTRIISTTSTIQQTHLKMIEFQGQTSSRVWTGVDLELHQKPEIYYKQFNWNCLLSIENNSDSIGNITYDLKMSNILQIMRQA